MLAVERRNTIKILMDCVRKNRQTADFPFAQDRLAFSPYFFNRVEIRAIRWKVEHLHALFLQSFPDGLDMVRTHIVHHSDIAWPKGRK